MVLVDISQFDQERVTLLTAKVKMTKHQYDVDMVEGEHMMGSRYRDDQRIARMIIGDIYAEVGYDLTKAQVKFLALDSLEMQPYIKKAVLESASCDHWYTYEKQW